MRVESLSTLGRVPPSARWLGLSGLLPTLAATLLVAVGPQAWHEPVVRVAIAYAAMILSFLGGAWWGLASIRAEASQLKPWLVVSVIPSLAAWPLVFFPTAAGLWVAAMCFAATLIVDLRMVQSSLAPAWWWSLRWPLSLAMAALHAAMGGMSVA